MLTLIAQLQELKINTEFNSHYDFTNYQNKLYLAGVNFNTPTENPFLKIFIYDNFKKNWQIIYNQLLQVDVKLNNYQVKFIEFNNLYKKNNLFLFFKTLDNCLILRLEETHIFVNVTESIQHLIPCINNPYLSNQEGILLIESIKQNGEKLINFKHWQDWSEKEAKIIEVFNNNKNIEIEQIIKYKDSIYCTVNNQLIGCELYKVNLQKNIKNPEELIPIIRKGAYRYSLNQKIFALTTFKNCLYLACGLNFNSQNSVNYSHLYKTGFELIRIYPDDDWDIITGSPRFSPEGLKVPLSALDCGFGDINNNLVESLLTDNKQLYLLTKNLENLQIWCSDNGEDWQLNKIDFPLNNYLEVKIIKTTLHQENIFGIIEINNLDQTKDLHVFVINLPKF